MHPGAKRLKAKGNSRFPERRDPQYRAFVKAHDCAVATVLHDLTRDEILARHWWPCGSRPERDGIEFAHLKTQGSGGDDRGNGWPACAAHHDEQEGKTKQFIHKYGVDLYQVAADLDAEYERAMERGLIPRPAPIRESAVSDDGEIL